ncbi:helix-turn-helix domain-containing protein [Faecalibacillus intestinalis]|uniref:helix-turn-helix domain-containing protein n=1 Tax=Faecalibacillus intestinalis TaxID=1982626 RepID=UPI0022E30DEE|nr:helix-turn-helix transcriptional regulator [Faecalibacillus intestinalis]
MTVGENIKKIRKEKGLTQKELGKLCGMSEAQIGQYENGLRNPKMETLEKIANALDISYFELLDISETTKESNIQKITLNVEIKNIDEETKKAEKLIELLKEAKSLADDLASIDFEIHV